MHSTENTHLVTSWRHYAITIAESFIAFYMATFCMAMFFSHQGKIGSIAGIFLCILYLFVIVISIKRMIEKLSMAAIMLMAPIAPLAALIFVISLIPILQKLQ